MTGAEHLTPLLQQWDLYSVVQDEKAVIYDCDGEHYVTVSLTISSNDMLTLLRHGKHMRDIGERLGEENVRSQLRKLIGAQPEQV